MSQNRLASGDLRSTSKVPRRLGSLAALWRSVDVDWHYTSRDKRDLRLDLLRGSAVFVMVVDHFGGPSWFYLITGNNQFFTSGAEAFVVISGLVVGMVYRDILRREGLRAAARKAWMRARTLYLLTIVLTLCFATVSTFFRLPWARGVDLGNPLIFAFNVLILHETYYLADIPMMYAIFMALVPPGLWLLAKNRGRWLLLLSFLVWVGYQFVSAEQIMIWPTIGNSTFHPAAWQLFFAWAMVAGYHRDEIGAQLQRFPKWPYFLIALIMFLMLLDLYSPYVNLFDHLIPGFREQVLAAELFSKSSVAPGRILATVILFQFMYLLLTNFWKPLRKALGWLCEPLGQNALYSYTMHVVVIGLFYILLEYLPLNLFEHGTVNTLLQLAVLLLIWSMIQRRFLFSIVSC